MILYRVQITISDNEPSALKEVLPIQEITKGCLYNTAKFSQGMSYYVLECKGPGVPKVYLFHTSTNKQISLLNNNAALEKAVSNMSLPIVRIFDVPLPASNSASNKFGSSSTSSNLMGEGSTSGYNASVRLFLPPEINVKTFMSYPLVVQV